MRASNQWTKGLNAGRKRIGVKDRSVSWVDGGVRVCLLSDDDRTFNLDLTPDEADALAVLLAKQAANIRKSGCPTWNRREFFRSISTKVL
jgi:hypothetical protein